MITLNGTLQTAQEAQARHPLVKLIASQWAGDIPFDGQNLNTQESAGFSMPEAIVHSAGGIAAVYITAAGTLIYVYTDTERQAFNYVTLSLSGVSGASLCELANGNIGIIYITGTYNLRYHIITFTGTQITDGSIGSWADATFPPSVIRLANGTYLMTYVKLIAGAYTIYKRTASDFTSWSAESALSISGVTNTNPIANVSLMQDSSGSVHLFFDYWIDDISNISYSTSSDNGATWGARTAVTSSTNVGVSYEHPSAAQKAANEMTLFYTKIVSAFHIDSDSDGYCFTGSLPGRNAAGIYFDETERKLYAAFGHYAGGLKCVLYIDVDTWTIEHCWKCDTSPGFNTRHCTDFIGSPRLTGDGGVAVLYMIGDYLLSVIDGVNNTITQYSFDDFPSFGITKNISGFQKDKYDDVYFLGLMHTQIVVNDAGRRLYCLFWHPFYTSHYELGYIDLDEVGPTYTWNIVIETPTEGHMYGNTISQFQVIPEEDIVVITATSDYGDWAGGGFWIFLLSNGTLWKGMVAVKANDGDPFPGTEVNPGIPWGGVYAPHYLDGKLYFSFTYRDVEGWDDQRGLFELTLGTWQMRYYRPEWGTYDEYGLHYKCSTDDNKLLIASEYGVTLFDPISTAWQLYSNASLPGFTLGGDDTFQWVQYDAATSSIIGNKYGEIAYNGEVNYFSRYGWMKQSYYSTGTYSGSWSFSEGSPVVTSKNDYEAIPLYAGGLLYIFWSKQSGGVARVYWDAEVGQMDLSDYLVRGREVSVSWNIEGNPTELTFSVSHGHMFDPFNTASLWNAYLKKGKKVTLQFGDRVSGSDYYQNQGVFIIADVKMKYANSEYPVMEVTCRDRFDVWDDHEVTATSHYTEAPDQVIQHIVTAHTDMVVADIDIPSFGSPIQAQWIESNLMDIIIKICDRFGYFPILDVDGKLTCRQVSLTGSASHAYSDLTKIFDLTPDTSSSDHTNRIIVSCTENDPIQTMFNEERVGSLNGTCGWWGYKHTFEIWYSTDKTRICLNPRLVKLESVSSMMMEMFGGVDEYISYIDPNNRYCVITVTAPNLLPLFIVTLAALVAAIWIPSGNTTTSGAPIIPWGSIIRTLLMVILMNIVGSIGNFQYEIYAQPLGFVRRTVQSDLVGHGNDIEYQNEIGMIVQKKIEEPLCYTVAECNEVADYEISLVRARRKTVSLSKTADLRDEVGDKIQVIHPASGMPIKFFAISLKRSMSIPEDPDGEGKFTDELEGWLI